MNIETLQNDKETLHIMNIFKTVKNKQNTADTLAEKAVAAGLENNNPTFLHYYGDITPDFAIKACISFGLLKFMIEDFYVIKEVLGYNYVLKLLKNADVYITVIK